MEPNDQPPPPQFPPYQGQAAPPPPPSFPPPPGGGSSLPPYQGAQSFQPYQQTTLGGYPAGGPQSTTSYAGWWSRVAATILDGLIGFLFAIPAIVLFIAAFAGGHDDVCSSTTSGTCRVPNGPLAGLAVLAGFVGFVVYYVIICRMVGRTGQSWGRKAMGYRIVDGNTGQFIGAWRAFGRIIVSSIIDGICYLGYLWPLWDPRKQKLSDKIMNTVAVKGA